MGSEHDNGMLWIKKTPIYGYMVTMKL
jgi:hypothetical protein